jgi:hypothetical protein
MKRFIPALILLALALSAPAWSQHAHPERWYQSIWCEARGGVMEVVMPSGSRCDCVTDASAVEFDFAKKWAESVGQALNYAAQTGKRAGVVLILEREGDRRFVEQVKIVRDGHKLPLDIWVMDREGNDLGLVE